MSPILIRPSFSPILYRLAAYATPGSHIIYFIKTLEKYSIASFTSKMSDDEADPELLELLRQSLGLGPPKAAAPPNTGVLKSAEFVYDNSIDVSIVSGGTKAAAASIWQAMRSRDFAVNAWSQHELHPQAQDETTVNFIFTMDLLNFSFWSELIEDERFQVDYKDRRWTGYWSLVAALQRALDEGESHQQGGSNGL